jgi:hypothetical protein
MKKVLILFCVLLVIVSLSTCGGDSVTGIFYNPMFGGYDEGEAGVNMTLAALCYTAENNPNVMEIRDSLILQLSDTTYSTRGQWKLAWGPGVSLSRGNLMYVAVDSTSDTTYFTIAVRGTDWEFPSNIEEDMEVWNLVRYPYGGAGDSVAEGSFYGLDTLLAATDPIQGQTLEKFLDAIPLGHLKMYVTGHSLGGALATLVTSWFVYRNYTNKFKLETYTFASPSVGNASFVDHYHTSLLSAGAENHRVVNTKDLVPYAWAGLNNIIHDNVPIQVPLSVAVSIGLIQSYFNTYGIVYKHVETRVPIGYLTPTDCNSGSYTEQYFCWVAFEHNTNNYLRLLHADTVNVR